MSCKHENTKAGIALNNHWRHVPRNHCQGPHNAKTELVMVVKCSDCGKSWQPGPVG